MRLTVARSDTSIKEKLLKVAAEAIDAVLAEASSSSVAQIERSVWGALAPIGRGLLEAGLAVSSRELTTSVLEDHELAMEDISFRDDGCYNATLTSTLGEVTFPLFAFRHGGQTHAPARDRLLPGYRECRSTPMCVEFEAFVAKSFAFRTAEDTLRYVTHGAVTVADNTIGRHSVALGKSIDPTWLYRHPDEIAAVLHTMATRDRKTGRPLLYISSDAHMLRRYVDDTWGAEFKATNGIRLWCEDARTGDLIHLGGEYTWDSCLDVVKRFQRLQLDGVLPEGGHYNDDVHAQYVFVSDGAPWLGNRLPPLFDDIITILDPYHALQWIADFADDLHALGVKKPVMAPVRRALGFQPDAKQAPRRRKGHKKKSRRRRHAHNIANWDLDAEPGKVVDDAIAYIETLPRLSEAVVERCNQLVETLRDNQYRMAYDEYRRRGLQIGSGAMESLHRQASQLRLKLPGIRMSAETGEALINLRLLALVERWDEFFQQENIEEVLALAFGASPRNVIPLPALAA